MIFIDKYYLKKYNEVIECYDKAIEFSPDHSFLFYFKGIAFCHLEKYNEMIECYDKAFEPNPNDFEFFYYKGIFLNNLE